MPEPEDKVVPGGADLPVGARDIDPMHFHTPRTGGEIVWNNVQLAHMLNSYIAYLNSQVHGSIKKEGESEGKAHIPFVKVPPNPTIGFNTHGHTSEFDGGFIFGASLHDHRDNANGGFAYAVYHPGTNLPKLAYEREEVQPIIGG
jgi:hypothetical protein